MSKILFQVSFLRHAAYNEAGGKSLYAFNSLPDRTEASRASRVSLDRPGRGTPPTDPAAFDSWEAPLIRWLETEGIAIEYCSSIDLHTISDLLDHYECLLIAGHDEYWTKPMRDQTERFVANGGNMIVLSGNTCFRAVRLERENRLVVFHKYAGADTNPNADEATVAWAQPPLNRPQNSLFGVGWTEGAWHGWERVPSPTAYTIRFPTHWVFDGVSATTTSPFIEHETDAAAYVDEPGGYPRVTGEEGTPLAFTVLASADLRSWEGKPGRATMGIYSRNGTVFNAATTRWTKALETDPVIRQVTHNVFKRLKQRVPWDWEDVGHANLGCALTSLNGKLFMATRNNRLRLRYPVGADVPWRTIGGAHDVIAMASIGDTLYCINKSNRLYWRPPVEVDRDWTPIGSGPPGGTKALAAAGGMLYAVDTAGMLWTTPARRSAPSWRTAMPPRLPPFVGDPTVNAMASYSDILFASTTDNRLLRTNQDAIYGSPAWKHIHHCNNSIGLTVVEWMLFVATRENRLLRIDLHGLREP